MGTFKKRFLILTIAVLTITALSACSSGERTVKNFQSEYGGGLVRTVKVYSYNGNLLARYTGKIDVQTSDSGNKVLFDLNGKRHIFYNAIVTVDEK